MLTSLANRHAHKLAALITALAFLCMPIMNALAQTAPSNYAIEWNECTPATTGPDPDTFTASFDYTIRSTGERFQADLLIVDTPERAGLFIDYYAADGNLVASIEVTDTTTTSRVTERGQRLSQDAALALTAVLGEPDFQEPLDTCVAKCRPKLKKFLKGLCIAAATLCCIVASPACSLCIEGGKACTSAVGSC